MQNFKLFDAHLHIIDSRFPLTPNNGYLPETFTCEDYLERMQDYPLAGGAVVSGSFQAFDQGYLLAALQRLGRGFVGVTQLPATVADDELLALSAAGVRALRFNLKRGGSEDLRVLERMARRVHGLAGWHVELYVDSTELAGLYGTLVSLPAVSIDHFGLSGEGFPTLLRLAEHGVRVKASGFGRIDFEPRQALRELYSANPEALMFGSDLPSTRAPRPFCHADVQLLIKTLGAEGAKKVLYENAVTLYYPAKELLILK